MSTNYKIDRDEYPYFLTLTLVEWVDLFAIIKYRELMVDSLNFYIKNNGLIIYSYVIMSNHVHLIASSEDSSLAETIRSLKRFTAKSIYTDLREDFKQSRRTWLMWIFEYEGRRSSSNIKYKIWSHENHPVKLDSNEMIDQRMDYIHDNPIRVGICRNPEDYVYSSAGDYNGIQGFVDISFI